MTEQRDPATRNETGQPVAFATVHDVAIRLGTTRREILARVEEGRYPGAVSVDGMWHIPTSDLTTDGIVTSRIRPSNRTGVDFRRRALTGGVTPAPRTDDETR